MGSELHGHYEKRRSKLDVAFSYVDGFESGNRNCVYLSLI